MFSEKWSDANTVKEHPIYATKNYGGTWTHQEAWTVIERMYESYTQTQ